MRGWLILLAASAGFAQELVEVRSIPLDIRYATANNFTGKRVYDEARCFLRPEVAAKLALVQEDLQREGLSLKLYDCYRPLSIQRKFWELMPDERYVANPAKGSRHNRGAALDLTLTDAEGRELAMPSGYDDFSEKAHRDYRDAPAEALRNRERLERAMTRHGFVGLPTEWWHFDFAGWEKYPLLDVSFGALKRQ
ncbi:MAG: D-alanyl-D-alanine dipeptidase [Bryobacteraceae bacterium]|nr:D-alanyl-D-alanine dipeptidase [Bryobacteraceae bacterium]